MSRNRRLGLDELMIVNPGLFDGGAYLLGDDNVLYRVDGVPESRQQEGLGQFFLGEDGVLYQVQRPGTAEATMPTQSSSHSPVADRSGAPSRFFLGDNGMLYEVVDRDKA